MPKDRFVQPKVERLLLSEGDYVDVKKRLTHGEREDFFAAIAPYDVAGVPKFDRHVLRTTRLLTYMIGWSLKNNGEPVAYSPEMSDKDRISIIRNLDPDTFDEIHEAIIKHESAMEAERVAEKNGQDGGSALKAISPSPSDVIGGSSGSVN